MSPTKPKSDLASSWLQFFASLAVACVVTFALAGSIEAGSGRAQPAGISAAASEVPSEWRHELPTHSFEDVFRSAR